MSTGVYQRFMSLVGASGTTVDWTHSGEIFYCALLTGSVYAPNYVDHDYWNDVATYEFSDASYTSGGAQVSGRAIAEDGTNNFVNYTAQNIIFPSLNNGTVSSIVIYRSGTDATDSELICHLSGSSFPKTANGGDMTVSFTSNVVFRVSGV